MKVFLIGYRSWAISAFKAVIKQRKDKEDQIAQLIQQNEQLQGLVKKRENDFSTVSKKNLEVTEKQFHRWGVKYHDILFGKPMYDIFICDKVVNSEVFFKEE